MSFQYELIRVPRATFARKIFAILACYQQTLLLPTDRALNRRSLIVSFFEQSSFEQFVRHSYDAMAMAYLVDSLKGPVFLSAQN